MFFFLEEVFGEETEIIFRGVADVICEELRVGLDDLVHTSSYVR